jgi:3-carboxy-cis,cis-muconate cycloisomerase
MRYSDAVLGDGTAAGSLGGGAHAIDSLIYGDMFGTPRMRAIFGDLALVQYWLDVEAALARAQAQAELIPAHAAHAIGQACRVERINLTALEQGVQLVGYPILPLVRQVVALAGPEAGAYVHWGATTQDIMDTATSLQVRDARRLIAADLATVTHQLERLAATHRDTPMAGRTHGQQALPITLGYKLAVLVAELRRHADRIEALGPRTELVEFAGAAGTLASVGPVGLKVQDLLGRELGLHVPVIAWHTSRDGLAEFVCVLGLISASLAKLAQEVALLQRTEIGEVEEGYQPGRGGSSTMPQKRNPIASEAIIGASRVVRQLVPVMLDAMLHDGERATGPWHAEWLALPEAAILTHGQLAHTRELLDGLVINTERMRHNLGLSHGLITSEAVMMALAPKIGRQPAHDVVYEASMRAIECDRPLRDVLLEDSTVAGALSVAQVDDLLRPERYVGLASQFVDRVLERGGG